MSFPASFAESNAVFSRPCDVLEEECGVLSVLKAETESGTPVIVSCWRLTQAELAEINRTGRVWLGVMGKRMPPVFVDGHKPF